MKIFLGFILFFSVAFANETNSSADINSTSFQNIKKQSIFLSYEKYPSRVFVGQVFSIKVKAIIANKEFNEIKNRIYSDNGIKILNANEKWKWFSDEIFYKTFYMKAVESNATFPDMDFEIYYDDTLLDSQKFPIIRLNIINLNTDKYFCGVIAESLNILKSKTTTFDETSLITVLEIQAKNSNLKDFKLAWVKRDGIDSQMDNTPYYKIYYYAIIPKETKIFKFKYFNTVKNRFITKNIDIVVDTQTISTQSNLNPKDSSFTIYKNVSYALTVLVLIFLFIKRKKIVYILLLIITVTMFLIDINPFSSIKISSKTKVHILPTKNSTVFYITPRVLYAQKITSRNDYIKILLPNGKIGWIKEKNVIKN